MDDKLFCSKCGYRIWRNSDNRPFVDVYFQDRHFNCTHALAQRLPITEKRHDPSYAERRESVKKGVVDERPV